MKKRTSTRSEFQACVIVGLEQALFMKPGFVCCPSVSTRSSCRTDQKVSSSVDIWEWQSLITLP